VKSRAILYAVLAIQAIPAFFFISEILISVLGIPVAPINWQLRELVEVGAALGLVTGVVLGAILLRRATERTLAAEEALRLARSAFRDVLDERFREWDLTPAERDVALFAIKGFTTQDMARLRDVSEGTIKAQTAAIYRKAGVRGRPQLLSVFIDELVDSETTVERPNGQR
jgi:DNA-binding CsgD family transcriptional regulator